MVKKITIPTLLQQPTKLNVQPLIACWGFFDGIHKGHQTLFNEVLTIAHKKKYKAVVIGFDVKPQTIVNNTTNEILLLNKDKLAIINNYNFAYYLEITFTKTLATVSPQQFIAWLLALNIKAVVVSSNVRFGYKNQGTIKDLQQSALIVYLCDDIYTNEKIKISSTYIKQLLHSKDINKVNHYLQPFFYTIAGEVIHGIKEGRTLGFPTANLLLQGNYALPGLATYVTLTVVDDVWYKSMTVIMLRNKKPLVETYLLNFKQDIYGKLIKVKFLAFLRDNLQFTNLENLKKQLNIDLVNTIAYFKNTNW